MALRCSGPWDGEPEEDGRCPDLCGAGTQVMGVWMYGHLRVQWVCRSQCISSTSYTWQPKTGRFIGHVWLWVSECKEWWRATCVTLIFPATSEAVFLLFFFSFSLALWASRVSEVPYSSTRQWACYRLRTDCSCCHGTYRPQLSHRVCRLSVALQHLIR